MNYQQILAKLFKKYIRAEHVQQELDLFNEEVESYSADVMKIEADVKTYIPDVYLDREIPLKSRLETERIKIAFLSEIKHLTSRAIEEEIIFVNGFKGNKSYHLHVIKDRRLRIPLLKSKIDFLNIKIERHKKRFLALKEQEDNFTDENKADIHAKFRQMKEQIEKIDIMKVFPAIWEEYRYDGEMLSIQKSLESLRNRNLRGVMIYRDYQEGALIESLHLLDKVDEFYEEALK